MEFLPHKLLEAVFRHLSPEDLLGAVPLVCKRWREVARSKAAWRDAVVEFTAGNEAAVARIARLAPALGALNLVDGFRSHDLKFGQKRKSQDLIDSLILGVSDVRHVNLTGVYDSPHLVLELLHKYRETIVTLVVNVDTWWNGGGATERGPFEVISRMERLEVLDISFSMLDGEKGVRYCGQLGRGCPALQRLLFSSGTIVPGHGVRRRRGGAVLWDLLDKHGPRLTYLDVVTAWRPCHGDGRVRTFDIRLATAVRRCHNLVHVSLPSCYVSLLRDVRRLRSLELRLENDVPHAEMIAVAAFIRSSPVIANLSSLTVYHAGYDGHLDDWVLHALGGSRLRDLRALTLYDRDLGNPLGGRLLLRLLLPCLSNVVVLRQHPDLPLGTIQELTASLPKLRLLMSDLREFQAVR